MDAHRINVNIEKAAAVGTRAHSNAIPAVQPGKTFGDALARAAKGIAAEGKDTQGLRFSKHASARLNSREVELTPEQLKRVENGVTAALTKGVSDSLVLVDGYALVVNTRSMTVVTAMQSGQNGGVFTNINGAVIV
ncbi:MAG: flagellar protein [Defluviitaleaceae bacterium]|nr:flagellar protein [Defluviitaleaceae bacterium]MCL2835863.1 flagellar protein [Defluviitaleaceae bacterium]